MKKQLKYSIIISMLLLCSTLIISCGSSEEPPSSDGGLSTQVIDDQQQKLDQQAEEQRIRDSITNAQSAARAETDSMMKHFDVAAASVEEGGANDQLASDIDFDGIIPLYKMYDALESCHLTLAEKWEFSVLQVSDQIRDYAGIKRNSMQTWEKGMEVMIDKFSSSLSSGRRKVVANSLDQHAKLFEQLDSLSDADQSQLMQIMYDIVLHQSDHYNWIHSPAGDSMLKKQYNILKKVWDMPPLIEEKSHDNYTTQYLGKVSSYEGRTWTTRYENRFQFAVGVFHRRCMDVGASTPADRRAVSNTIADLMHKGAEKLRKASDS